MDNADIAQAQQEIMLAQQLAEATARQPHYDAHTQNSDGNYECIDCGDLVEPQRVKLGLTLRCIGCQQNYENSQRQKIH